MTPLLTTPRTAVLAMAPVPQTSGHNRRASARALTPQLQRRNQRLQHYLELVRPIAWHYANRCPETAEDLQQVGLMGLLRACELFDDAQGTPFPAFARPHIRGAILHYLRDLARPVRLPRRHQELEDRLRAVRRELEARLGRMASDEELRRALGLSSPQWEGFQAALRVSRPSSLSDLDAPAIDGIEGDGPQEPAVPAPELMGAFSRLNIQRQRVIRHVVLEGWSLRRTAGALGISPMTVSRQLRRGLDELRSALAAEPSRRSQFAC